MIRSQDYFGNELFISPLLEGLAKNIESYFQKENSNEYAALVGKVGERANSHETALTERIALYRVSRIQIALLDIHYKGFRLLAVDGSDLHTPTNPDDTASFIPGSGGQKPYNLQHLKKAQAGSEHQTRLGREALTH